MTTTSVTGTTTEGTPQSFSINRVIDAVLAEHRNEADPGRLADIVIQRVPKAMVQSVLRQLLRHAIGTRIRIGRAEAFEDAASDEFQPPKGGRPWTGRVAERLRSERIQIAGEWKRMGACTAADLMAAAAERRRLVVQVTAMAVRLERLAEAITAAGVSSLDGLPDAEIAKLSQEAA